jgi:hypothetical protein
MDDLPDDLLKDIFSYLDFKNKVVATSVCKRFKNNIVFTDDNNLCMKFCNVICNVGNNYSIYTSPKETYGMKLWHVVNIFHDMIVAFQYIFTRRDTAIFTRSLHCPRFTIESENIEKIITMFKSELPITSHDLIKNKTVETFFESINSKSVT